MSENKKRRQRKITWFNPPYSKNVQTNIGEKFLKLIDKNFPKDHPLRKIINRNTVKVSYKCMPNMKQKISTHNFKVLQGEKIQPIYGCNCTESEKHKDPRIQDPRKVWKSEEGLPQNARIMSRF